VEGPVRPSPPELTVTRWKLGGSADLSRWRRRWVAITITESVSV
jgi:hypothetical protein